MITLDSFKQFDLNNQHLILGGQKVIQCIQYSNGKTTWMYDDGGVDYCEDDNNDDYNRTYP
jgi:hypothetical protein